MTSNPNYEYSPPRAVGKWVELDASFFAGIDEHYRIYGIGPYARKGK